MLLHQYQKLAPKERDRARQVNDYLRKKLNQLETSPNCNNKLHPPTDMDQHFMYTDRPMGKASIVEGAFLNPHKIAPQYFRSRTMVTKPYDDNPLKGRSKKQHNLDLKFISGDLNTHRFPSNERMIIRNRQSGDPISLPKSKLTKSITPESAHVQSNDKDLRLTSGKVTKHGSFSGGLKNGRNNFHSGDGTRWIVKTKNGPLFEPDEVQTPNSKDDEEHIKPIEKLDSSELPSKAIDSANSNTETYEGRPTNEDQYEHPKEIFKSSIPHKHKGDFSSEHSKSAIRPAS